MPSGRNPTTTLSADPEAASDGAGSCQPSAARHLAASGTTVVVTCAEAGALAATPDGQVRREPAPVCKVEDPTGAGDLFAAALIWADLEGRALADQVRLATTYASLSLAAGSRRQKGLAMDDFQQELARRT